MPVFALTFNAALFYLSQAEKLLLCGRGTTLLSLIQVLLVYLTLGFQNSRKLD